MDIHQRGAQRGVLKAGLRLIMLRHHVVKRYAHQPTVSLHHGANTGGSSEHVSSNPVCSSRYNVLSLPCPMMNKLKDGILRSVFRASMGVAAIASVIPEHCLAFSL